MRIPAELYKRIVSELSKRGIQLGEAPVLMLAADHEALRRLESALPDVLSAMNAAERQEAEKFLKEFVECTKKVAAGLKGENQDYRNAMISLFSAYLAGWEPDRRMLAALAALVPEVYTDERHTYLVTDEAEAAAVVSLYPETVKGVLREHLKSSIRSVEYSGNVFTVDVLGLKFTVYNVSSVISALHSIGMADRARELLLEVIRNSLRNAKHVIAVKSPAPDILVIELDPAELNLGDVDRRILEGASIRIVGRLKYSGWVGATDAYIELDSPAIGIVRMPVYGFGVNAHDSPLKFISDAVDNLRIFLMKHSLLLLEVGDMSRRYGYEMNSKPPAEGYVYSVDYTKRDEVTAAVRVTVEHSRLIASMVGELTARIAGAERLRSKLERMLDQYKYYNPSVSISGETVSIKLAPPIGELRPEIFVVLNTLMNDLKTIASSAQLKAEPVNYLALYTALTALGVRNPLEAASRFAKLTQTELIASMKTALAAANLGSEPEVFVLDPDKILGLMIVADALTVDRNLEPVLMGRKMKELLAPFTEFAAHYNIDAVSETLSAYIVKAYYARKKTTVLERLAGGGGLTLDVVRRYLDLGGPMDVHTLLLPLQGGKVLWHAMDPELKRRALLAMRPEDIRTLTKHPGIVLSSDDRMLIVETYCEKVSPAVCTDFIVSEYPHLLPIPRTPGLTVKVVDDGGTKWIEAGVYRMQIEKYRRGDIVFRVHDRVTGNTYRVRASDIREAIKKVSIGDEVETVSA